MKFLLISILLIGQTAAARSSMTSDSSFLQKRRQNRVIRCARAVIEMGATDVRTRVATSYLKLLVENQTSVATVKGLAKRCEQAKRTLKERSSNDVDFGADVEKDLRNGGNIENWTAVQVAGQFARPEVNCIGAGGNILGGFFLTGGFGVGSGICTGNNGRIYIMGEISPAFGAGAGMMVFGRVFRVRNERIGSGRLATDRVLRLDHSLGAGFSGQISSTVLSRHKEGVGLGLGAGYAVSASQDDSFYLSVGSSLRKLRRKLEIR